jgi:hypothetical protein
MADPLTGTLTTTLIVQELLAAMVPPLNVTDPAPAVAVNVPPQVFVVVDGVATTMDCGMVGKVSEKATPVIAAFVPLLKVKVNVLV